MRTLLLWLLPLAVRAEFLDVRVRIERLECDTCRRSLEIGLGKMRGVVKVAVTRDSGASFTLSKGNRITLEQLREAVEKAGFQPTSAQVVAIGRARTDAGRWSFAVEGLERPYNLSSGYDAVLAGLRQKNGELITVRAEAPAPPDSRTASTLDVLAIE